MGAVMSDRLDRAAAIMDAFADRTGIEGAEPRRYLWTDAFAVCNYLALYRQEGSSRWLDQARALVRDVHRVLGRHHPDDPRTGWISGLDEAAGERRPTAGGLRIGKPLPERGPDEPMDERLEWERDGQYYHYLTRWMHALARLSEETDDPEPARQAVDLAQAAHRGFAHGAGGALRLYWKMSTDLSRPLVPSMGQHDALDGLVTTAAVQRVARALGLADGGRSGQDPELRQALRDLDAMCRGRGWATADALGIGGLLVDGLVLDRVAEEIPGGASALLERVLKDALRSLDLVSTGRYVEGPPERRLAFRELGLSIGLAATARLRLARAAGRSGEREAGGGDVDEGGSGEADGPVVAALEGLSAHLPLRERIEAFWLEPEHRSVDTWTEHRDINAVMLATSLLPDGYLGGGAAGGLAGADGAS